ncbi:MAG: metal-sensitive transcriptional regulator [bacterium]|nr:metal-sensitive transcriptional regulator [bacterium]
MPAKRNKIVKRTGTPAPNSAACGCVPGSASPLKGPARRGDPAAVREGVGPGAHAASVDDALKAANLKHLRRIEGQVRGLAGMIEEDRYCADIITQVSAVRESLQTVARNLMRNHLQHCATKAMHDEGMTREAMVDELMELVAKLRT